MKLRPRARKPAKRYVTINDTSLESQDAQAAAADPLIQDIPRCLSKIESILSTLLSQAYDGSETEDSRITLLDLLSCVAKLEEVANSATCEADTSQTSTSFPIEETTSFQSLLNISADEEVLKKEEIQRRSNQGETNLVIRDGKSISRPIIQKAFLWRAPVRLSGSKSR